jgi:hypothetical protein
VTERPIRIGLLCSLASELQHCGARYLATLLVGEAYRAEALESTVFGRSDPDAAAARVCARLRLARLDSPAPIEARRRRRKVAA